MTTHKFIRCARCRCVVGMIGKRVWCYRCEEPKAERAYIDAKKGVMGVSVNGGLVKA